MNFILCNKLLKVVISLVQGPTQTSQVKKLKIALDTWIIGL